MTISGDKGSKNWQMDKVRRKRRITEQVCLRKSTENYEIYEDL